MVRDVGHRVGDGRAEDVRMAVDHLLRDPLDDFDEVEAGLVRADLGIEDDLQQDVTQLFHDGRIVAGVDRFQKLVGLFERVGLDCFERLHAVPGTAVRRAEPGDDVAQLLKRRADAGRVGREAVERGRFERRAGAVFGRGVHRAEYTPARNGRSKGRLCSAAIAVVGWMARCVACSWGKLLACHFKKAEKCETAS